MLKALELFGFKSFADRTRFDFSAGITGVVGPNGSGKSNVVDGIKWILGDQSAKSLRGNEMTDVIFNGAAGRKPSQFAEATLTFDNASGFLPTEAHEVQIGRRLWRSGDSEYLINRAPARLKDIRQLFMGTGAGSAAYCIIEQGRVDQILQAGAIARRAIFEEAAGISLFKARKTEFVRRMERVDQLLARLTDIVDEVEAQRNSLRSQAEKAARYREVSDELRERWLGLAADDYRRCSSRLEQDERDLEQSKARIAQLSARQQQLEERLSGLDAELAAIEDRLRSVERRRATHREAIAGHEATIAHHTSRKRELETDMIRLRKQRIIMESRAREVAAELEHNCGVLDDCEREFGRLGRELAARERQIRELTGRVAADRHGLEQKREDLLRRMHVVSESAGRVKALQSQRDAAESARRNAETRLTTLSRQITAGQADCEQKQRLVEEADEQVRAAEESLRHVQLQRESLAEERDLFQRTLAERREQRSAWQARKSVLEDLEARQEGFGIGVREILARAETSDYPPWNSILGSVADLLEVDLEHAALLEVALGNRAQLIVLQELGSLVEYLKSGTGQISGRVGFVSAPSSVARAQTTFSREPKASAPDLSTHAGVRTRADRLVRPSEKHPGLAEQLLADTWVVETIDVALELAAGEGRGCRFVTLQGELLEPDGTLTVGTVRSETAVVSRKSELRQLKNDLLRLERKVAEDEKRLSSVGSSLSGIDVESQGLAAELQALTDRRGQLKSEHAAALSELERLRRDRDTADEEITGLDLVIRQYAEEIRSAEMGVATAEEDLQSLQAEIDEAERDVARAEHRIKTLEQRRTTERLDLAKQEERLGGLRESFERLERDREQRLQQRDEAERRLEAGRGKRRQIELSILNTRSALAELFLADQSSAVEAATFLAGKNDLRDRRRELLTEESSLREERRSLGETAHEAEIRIRETRHQLATLAQRIEEEYQLDLQDVVESGASAFETYLREQHEPAGDDAYGAGREEASPSARELAQRNEHQGDDVDSHDSKDRTPHHSPLTTHQTCFEDVRDELEARVNRLRRKLKLMGSVNTDSLNDLDELEDRYGRLSATLADLVEAKKHLEDLVRKINVKCRQLFVETFEAIRGNFQELFRQAFGGGDGNIVLEDSDDVLECGIDVVARPPGKELKSISLMSGGEKTLTAFALLLAIFRCRPSPYCVLDEVDAALDEANVERLLALLEGFKQTTQFVTITHKKPTMAIADLLYGVTMEESGVSKRLTVRFEDVRENGEFKPPTDAGELNAAA